MIPSKHHGYQQISTYSQYQAFSTMQRQPSSTLDPRILLAFLHFLPRQLHLQHPPLTNLPLQPIILSIKIQRPCIRFFFHRQEPFPPFKRHPPVNLCAIPGSHYMITNFDLVPVFHLIGIFIHIYPIELRGPRANGGDEPFALPAPVVLGMWEEIAGERVGGRFFEFELIFQRDVEVLCCLNIKLKDADVSDMYDRSASLDVCVT